MNYLGSLSKIVMPYSKIALLDIKRKSSWHFLIMFGWLKYKSYITSSTNGGNLFLMTENQIQKTNIKLLSAKRAKNYNLICRLIFNFYQERF
jgi:hypothetical protein